MPKRSKKPAISADCITISKTACKKKRVCIMVKTRYGLCTGACSLSEAAYWCGRPVATVRQWLDDGCINDKAAAQLLAVYVAGVLPWEAFEGFRVLDDGKMIDTVGRGHTHAEIQERGLYWGENQRLRATIKSLSEELEELKQTRYTERTVKPVKGRPHLRLVK